MADKNTLRNWFLTNLKPTQAQFWALFDSYFHKDEKIPITAIDNIEIILAQKADAEILAHHLTNVTAHADLFLAKEDKNKKGVAGGYVPLNEFVKIASDYLNLVNDLFTGGATALLSAEQGVVLQNQIDGIKALLVSDNINLDNVQEIVDAIENVQTSLSTILVNDLTTGGTTKALTAEMGKTLKGLIDALTTAVGNKVDKVAGERLINAGEITKLAGLGSIATTVKPILSTALTTQNVAGFVTYINALNPVLVVGASEIVKYTTTDTGRVFQLNLRGRSFGVGQPAIVAADVLEITDFLNKDIRLSNYPSTRNDGQLPTNKVLAPDANGNVKLYSIAVAPAPWIKELIPDSYSPDTTGNIRILGDFFTPEMCNRIINPNAIIIGGVTTIHYANFISSQEILANVTTGSVEGNFSITLNNGLQTVKANALLIVLGVVYTPEKADFTSIINPIMLEKGKVLTSIANAEGSAIWNKPFNTSLNFEVRLNHVASPFLNFGTSSNGAQPWFNTFELRRTDNNSIIAYGKSIGNQYIDFYNPNDPVDPQYAKARIGANSPYPLDTFPTLRIKYVQGIFYFFTNNILSYTFPNDGNRNLTTNVYIKFIVGKCDVSNIKYIELAS